MTGDCGKPVAVVRDVSFGYGQELVVRHVSFSLYESEYVCLIGRNGSGKSTLLKGMLGLIEPRTGSVELPGGVASAAFLPQEPQGGRDFPATVWEVALSGCQRGGRSFFNSSRDKRLARESLDAMGIADLAGRRMGSLSGGQRQRAFLARCLCREPRLLLLDEPYTGLDPEAADGLTGVLRRLRQERNIAVLMSSHDLAAVAGNASRVLVIDGSLQFDGDVREWLRGFKPANGTAVIHGVPVACNHQSQGA
ncbi:MAG: metal ABC transporter ATP-binding protein [Planctomycetaceae bacterium]|nr:metal ABC transporter ATP-binding protein [Planctomycetaceae bacterium]